MIESFRRSGIDTRVILPILGVGLLSALVGSLLLESILAAHLTRVAESETANVLHSIRYSLRADYSTLFYRFGDNQRMYPEAEAAAQKEALRHVGELVRQSGHFAVVHTDSGVRWFGGPELGRVRVALEGLSEADSAVVDSSRWFIAEGHFSPWNWDVYLARDKRDFLHILREQRLTVLSIIVAMILAIIVFLLVALRATIDRPLEVIFRHLDRIKGGNYAALHLRGSREFDHLVGNINDMSRTIETRVSEMRKQQQATQDVLDSQTGIVVVTDGRRVLAANRRFFGFFDRVSSLDDFYHLHAEIGEAFPLADEAGYEDRHGNWLGRILTSPRKVVLQKEGRAYVFKATAQRMQEEGRYVVSFSDITELEEYRRKIENQQSDLLKQLYLDPLTGLPNRASLVRDIAGVSNAALLLVDIDAFKEVNDFYGARFGDEVLVRMARLLEDNQPFGSGKLYRLQGDEYGILTDEMPDRAALEVALAGMCQVIGADCLEVEDQLLCVTVTVGAAMGNDSPVSLLARADMALEAAKSGKHEFRVYEKTMDALEQYQFNIEWTGRLRAAFDGDRVVPYFQPIFNNQTDRIEKYETLVRVIEPGGKVISPFVFLDIARKSKLYPYITRRVIDKSFQYFSESDCEFSINLSLEDMLDTNTRSFIYEKLERYSGAGRVVFEILESENIENCQEVSEFVRQVRSMGCKVAIDDFGTGYSNFQHLLRLDIDYVKIDGSLVKEILVDDNAALVTEAIVDFARRLGARTIAEYVDNEAVFQKVKAMGIDYTQGYFIAPPRPDAVTVPEFGMRPVWSG